MSASGSRPSGSSGATPTVPGAGGGGTGTPNDGGNVVRNFVKEWIAPSALAAIVLAIMSWLLVGKFDAINDQIKEVRTVTDHLDQRLSDAEKANLAVNLLLHNEFKILLTGLPIPTPRCMA